MKIITIKIKETNNIRPYTLVREIDEDLKIDELSTLPTQPAGKTESYPIAFFAYGKHIENFYIREQDREPLAGIMRGFTKQARIELIDEIMQYFIENGTKHAGTYLTEIEKREKAK